MREEPSGRGRPGDIPFGNRHLTEDRDVFEHNAWDNMPWDEEMEKEAKEIVERQKAARVSEEKGKSLLEEPAAHWDAFYSQHTNKFFMDRNWLLKEFPELDTTQSEGSMRALEVGCGVGNTTFPILDLDKDKKLFLYSCDFSLKAVQVLKTSEKFDPDRCAAFVWDITQCAPSEAPPPESLDLVICIYVLSAIEPKKLQQTLAHLRSLLKPGGALLLKDYGRYDMAQLRFKADRLIDDNLYCRGDGTLVYFFDAQELDDRLAEAGMEKVATVVDRRLIVNRAKKVKMQRVWLQAKYRKPNKKVLLRLSAETLKYHQVFENILAGQECRPLREERLMEGDMGYIYVCMYELLVGRGTKELPHEIASLLAHYGPLLRDREKELAGEGRGLESMREKKEQREKECMMPRLVVRLAEGEQFIDRIKTLKSDEVLIDPHVRGLLVFPFHPDFHSYWMVSNRNLILQDKASCLPAFLLSPPPNSSIIDACSAPGMKTSHLAALMQNTGEIFAFDRSNDRVETMKDMLSCGGVKNTRVSNEDFLRVDTSSKQYAKVEYALVDPPCSGSGIVKRMDEWIGGGVDEYRLSKLANLQAMLVKHAMTLPALKRVVYSTCSVHETENELVVAEVLKDVSHFRVVEGVLPEWTERGRDNYDFGRHCLRADPSKTATNGFFVAVFERVEGMEEEREERAEKSVKRGQKKAAKRAIKEENDEKIEEAEKKKTKKDSDGEKKNKKKKGKKASE